MTRGFAQRVHARTVDKFQVQLLSRAEFRHVVPLPTPSVEAGTTLRMRSMTRAMAERYVRLDSPLDCAGSYRIEARGVALFDEIDGDSPGAIEGVPLLLTLGLLRRFGIDPLLAEPTGRES